MWPSCEKLSRPFHHASPAREYRSSLRVRASRIQDIEMDRPTFMAEAPIPVVKVRMPPRELLLPALQRVLYGGMIVAGEEVYALPRDFVSRFGLTIALAVAIVPAPFHLP